MTDETYGQKLRRLRLELGLSQPEVSRIAGVSQQTISVWEANKREFNTPEAAVHIRRAIAKLMQRKRNQARK